jgi:hypothetical protein
MDAGEPVNCPAFMDGTLIGKVTEFPPSMKQEKVK